MRIGSLTVIPAGLLAAAMAIGPVAAQTASSSPPAAAAPALAQSMLAKPDRDFVEKAAQGGVAEVELSKLAQKSANPDVRRFAERMIADHGKVNARLTAIAGGDRVAMPQTPDIDHQKLREKLANEHDGDFDRDYARAMVADHDRALKLFQQEEQSGRDSQLSEFARNTLPILQQHRQMAYALASKLNATAKE